MTNKEGGLSQDLKTIMQDGFSRWPAWRMKASSHFVSVLTTVSAAAGGEASSTLQTRMNGIPLVGNAPSWRTCSRRAERVAAPSASGTGGRARARSADSIKIPTWHRTPSAPRAKPAPPAARRQPPRGAGAARGEGKGFSRDWARFPVL